MKVPFLTSGLVFIVFLQSFSQNGIIKHFGVEDGLASNRIYTAFQDHKGYIWLATTNGVSRFDGKEFKNYTSNNGLPDNDIFDIREDGLGRIWLSCYNGEPCYIYNDRVHTTSEDPLLNQIPKQGYFRFSQFANKLILTKSANAPCYEIGEAGILRKIPLQGVFFLSFKKNLLNISSSKTNRVFNYFLLDSNYKKVDSLLFPGKNSKTGESAEVEEIYASGKESFVVLLKNGSCLRYKIQRNKIVSLPAAQKTPGFTGVYHFNGNTWINVPNVGIIPVTEQFQKDPQRETLFAHITVQNLMIDREGNYWACTSGKGLYMIPNNNFSYYNPGNGSEQNDVLKLAASADGGIYLGCANTILKYPGNISPFDNSSTVFASFQDKIVDLYSDSVDLVAATTGGLLIFSKKTKEIKKISIDNIKCMRKGPDNSVLFGTHSGCYQFSFPDKLTTIFNRRTVAVYQGKNGDILIGTLYGLFRAKKNNNGVWITDAIKLPAILAKTRISCIGEIDDIIVAGTVQKGLVLINGNDYEFVNLGPELSNINCKDLFVDKNKTIWLSSFSGIFKIKFDTSIHSCKVQNIKKFNGLLSDDVNDILVVHDSVYVAGPNGLSVFSTKQPREKSFPPTLYINDIFVNGRSYPAMEKKIRLPSDSNTIDLHFSAIDFKSLGNVLFKYRLTDIQKSWHYTSDNFVRFEALPPGVYTLEVWAMNAENSWSPLPALLEINIAPAWWQTTLFYLFLILSGVALIYFVIRIGFIKKHNTQMRENSLKRHVAELELRALKAQINPHFIFNTLNAIQYFINNNENEKAETYLNRMADLLRKTLDFSDKTTVPVQAEIKYLENYLELEKLRFDENFIFTITNNLPEHKRNTEIPPMVLQPHIENALRHGFKNKHNSVKKLDITFSFSDKQLICEVLDNGIGRRAASVHYRNETNYRSRGMELSHSKLLMYESITGKVIKTDIHDNYSEDRQTATGTLIRISISQ